MEIIVPFYGEVDRGGEAANSKFKVQNYNPKLKLSLLDLVV